MNKLKNLLSRKTVLNLRLWLTGFFIVLVVVGCDQNPVGSTAPSGGSTAPKSVGRAIRIQGMVTDSSNGTPVTGATVQVFAAFFFIPFPGEATKTDSFGRYSIVDTIQCDDDNIFHFHGLIASATAFKGVSKTIQCTENIQQLDFQLPRLH